jgi:hypothetical protein
MLIMLLNVKIHVLVKIEVLAVSLIPEGLKFGHNGAPGQHNTLPTKEKSVQGPIHLLPILGLAELLHVTPPAQFPPATMEDVVNRDNIDLGNWAQKARHSLGSQGLQRAGSGSSQCAIWGPYDKARRQLRHIGSLAGQKAGGLQSCHQYPHRWVPPSWDVGCN